MLQIEKFDHVGIRVSDKDTAIDFYGKLGFGLVGDAGFEAGHPLILRHAESGVTLNLLGPATTHGENVLMDVDAKHPGITHMALRVASLDDTKASLAEAGIEITGAFSFGGLSAVFIRDPDRNVIELDQFQGDESEKGRDGEIDGDYSGHPA